MVKLRCELGSKFHDKKVHSKLNPNLNPNSGQIEVELRLELRLKLGSSFLTLKHPTAKAVQHQQNTSLLVGTCGILEQLGSESKQVQEHSQVPYKFVTSYLGST